MKRAPIAAVRTGLALFLTIFCSELSANGWSEFERRCLIPTNMQTDVVTSGMVPMEEEPVPNGAEFGFWNSDGAAYLLLNLDDDDEIQTCIFGFWHDIEEAVSDFQSWRDLAVETGTHEMPPTPLQQSLKIVGADTAIVRPGTSARATVIMKRAKATDLETGSPINTIVLIAQVQFQD